MPIVAGPLPQGDYDFLLPGDNFALCVYTCAHVIALTTLLERRRTVSLTPAALVQTLMDHPLEVVPYVIAPHPPTTCGSLGGWGPLLRIKNYRNHAQDQLPTTPQTRFSFLNSITPKRKSLSTARADRCRSPHSARPTHSTRPTRSARPTRTLGANQNYGQYSR